MKSRLFEYACGDPLDCYQQWLATRTGVDRMLVVAFTIKAYWLADQPLLSLTALYLDDADGLSISVTDAALGEGLGASDLSATDQYLLWSQQFGFARYRYESPIALEPRAIAKPWGQEIWYTGIEERGVCCFIADGLATPIPWLQSAVPGNALGRLGEGLVLLKILDPLPQEVNGDLYFELHEEKQEVYVVTNVDRQAWPDGVGYIRMGFDPQKLRGFGGDQQAFRAAYLGAVQRYESVRRRIDELPTDVEADAQLKQMEADLRAEMDSYSHLQPLSTGDVVKVPLLTPHSLQHGVRTVEFQTPVYERKILSFAQKVLTQDHWDTAQAVAQMHLHSPQPESFTIVRRDQGLLEERIVDFSDFEVRRLRLSPAVSADIEPLRHYGLVIVVEGDLLLAGEVYGPERALMLPGRWCGELMSAQAASGVVFLLALPRD